MPIFEQVRDDPVLYAHASRILHLESNPGNARALVQRHGDTRRLAQSAADPAHDAGDGRVYELPYQRVPHPAYGDAKIPAYEMIRFSVTIQRGCFGGCTFCSITEHEGRIIQSRSRGLDPARDRDDPRHVPGFTGVISDLGGPTANMYRLACKSREIEAACRRPSCVYPGICPNLGTDHAPLIKLYRKARALPGRQEGADRVGRALRPRDRVARVREGARAAPHRRLPEDRARGDRARGRCSKMMKPGIGTYDRFKELFDTLLEGGGQGAVPDPVLHRRASGHDRRGHARARAVAQAQRLPRRPGAGVPAVADGDRDRDVPHGQEPAAPGHARRGRRRTCPKGINVRRLHKAFLRYHDPNNWPMLREALKRMGRAGSDRQRQASARADVPAPRYGQIAGRQTRRARQTVQDAAHALSEATACSARQRARRGRAR